MQQTPWTIPSPLKRQPVQVIFLDSDNVAVGDPAVLLEAPEYMSTGALLWPDFWTSAAAPDLRDILDIPALVPGSFESGQMVFDKQRCARCPQTSHVRHLPSQRLP